MKIYLAGPINGCTDEEAFGWREDLHRRCAYSVDPAVMLIDPMSRDERGREDDAWADVVAKDKADIGLCDAIIANCWKTSVGTPMEILYSWERQKTVVVVVPEGQPVSPWYRAHSAVVLPNPGDAWQYLVGP